VSEMDAADALDAERAAWNARIAALADEDLRPRVMNLADEVFHTRLARLTGEQQSWPVGYIPDPFLWMTDYPTVDDMAANYHAGLIAFTDGDVFRGSVDINQPFEYPFDTSFSWNNVSLVDGTVVPVSGAFSPVPPDVQVNGFGRSLSVIPTAEGFGPETPLPARAVGAVTLAVPNVMHRFRLTAADIGRPKAFDGYSVTLTQLRENTVRLNVSRADGARISFERTPLIVAATDDTCKKGPWGFEINSRELIRKPLFSQVRLMRLNCCWPRRLKCARCRLIWRSLKRVSAMPIAFCSGWIFRLRPQVLHMSLRF